MSTHRVGAVVAVLTALIASLPWGTAALPIANADDPLAPIIGSVKDIRSGTLCAQLVYNPRLQDAAQKYARSEDPGDARPNDYPFRTDAFLGSGDPQLNAIYSAYNRGAHSSIVDCSFTEFGVGFVRHEDREVDVVTIVFGQPSMPDGTPPASSPAPAPAPAPPVQCPASSSTATVPAGQTCAPSTHSVTVAITKAGFGKIDVTLTNGADVDASCAYTATPLSNPLGILPTVKKTVAVKAKGTVTLNENAPPPTTTYTVSVPCTGTFNGASVALGDSAQTVSG